MNNLSVTVPERKPLVATPSWWICPKVDEHDKELVLMATDKGASLPMALVRDQATAESVIHAVNNHKALLYGLESAAHYLGMVIRGQSSIAEAVDAIQEIENIVKNAGGSI